MKKLILHQYSDLSHRLLLRKKIFKIEADILKAYFFFKKYFYLIFKYYPKIKKIYTIICNDLLKSPIKLDI